MSTSAPAAFNVATLERFAELIVGFGANVQPGQIVALGTEPGKERLTRAIAAAAYRAGAKFVDVAYFDLHVKRARIQSPQPDTLDFVPAGTASASSPWASSAARGSACRGPWRPACWTTWTRGSSAATSCPSCRRAGQVVNERTTNWTIAPCPTAAWAQLVHPDLHARATPTTRLWEQILRHVCRLDEDDPAAAWRERIDAASCAAAARMTERRFDALHFEGPGTDLTVGLLPSSRWMAASFETVDGIEHHPNLPSEEIVHDARPAAGRTASCARPSRSRCRARSSAAWRSSSGPAARCASTPTPGPRPCGRCATATRARRRLGEVALVDREGRIGPLDTVFFDTLLDENAASHIALGRALRDGARRRCRQGRANVSAIHIDFMIGSPEVRRHRRHDRRRRPRAGPARRRLAA